MLKVKVDADEIRRRDYFRGPISTGNFLLYLSKTPLLSNTRGRFSFVLGLLIDKGWNGVWMRGANKVDSDELSRVPRAV